VETITLNYKDITGGSEGEDLKGLGFDSSKSFQCELSNEFFIVSCASCSVPKVAFFDRQTLQFVTAIDIYLSSNKGYTDRFYLSAFNDLDWQG